MYAGLALRSELALPDSHVLTHGYPEASQQTEGWRAQLWRQELGRTASKAKACPYLDT